MNGKNFSDLHIRTFITNKAIVKSQLRDHKCYSGCLIFFFKWLHSATNALLIPLSSSSFKYENKNCRKIRRLVTISNHISNILNGKWRSERPLLKKFSQWFIFNNAKEMLLECQTHLCIFLFSSMRFFFLHSFKIRMWNDSR